MSDETDLMDKLADELARLRGLLEMRHRGADGMQLVADAHAFAVMGVDAPPRLHAPGRGVQALIRVGMEDDDPTDGELRAWREVVGRRLRHSLRVEDVVQACGTADYACMITGLPSVAVARRVCLRVATHLVVPGSPDGKRTVRTAIGVALFPGDGDSVEQLMAVAGSVRNGAGHAPLGIAFATGPLPPERIGAGDPLAHRPTAGIDCV